MTEPDKTSSVAMPFWDHVSELAKRLKVVLYVLIVSTILFMALPSDLSFLANPFEFYDPLVALFLRQIRAQVLPPDVRLIGYEMTAPMELYLMASFIFGFVVTIPVVAYEIYRFIDPALYHDERRAVYPFVMSFTVLFLAGAAFGFIVIMPLTLWALFRFFPAVGAEQIVSIMDFYNMVFVSTIFCGLAFTWPVFFVLLVKFGLVGTSMISKNRKYVYAGLFIGIMFITTDGGPLVDAMLLLPMIVLTEIAIYFGKRYEKSKPTISVPAKTTPKCRFCSAELETGKVFCDSCGKAQY
ncbi:twin-arginine translocase subunit TatC [Candidatus Bathyarchaeota archaeon]|nr:twin-arginine translocase subunit TatC [Candidatus Bathyarchaeota archaeon]